MTVTRSSPRVLARIVMRSARQVAGNADPVVL
jgi:hypothetical protein